MVGAVIYVRVSTKEQIENLSRPTQLRACEEYCRREGYEILERFREEGENAKTADRPQLQRLLKYCRTHKDKVHFDGQVLGPRSEAGAARSARVRR
jgi:site-specific DNA recombinase